MRQPTVFFASHDSNVIRCDPNCPGSLGRQAVKSFSTAPLRSGEAACVEEAETDVIAPVPVPGMDGVGAPVVGRRFGGLFGHPPHGSTRDNPAIDRDSGCTVCSWQRAGRRKPGRRLDAAPGAGRPAPTRAGETRLGRRRHGTGRCARSAVQRLGGARGRHAGQHRPVDRPFTEVAGPWRGSRGGRTKPSRAAPCATRYRRLSRTGRPWRTRSPRPRGRTSNDFFRPGRPDSAPQPSPITASRVQTRRQSQSAATA